MVPSSLTVLDAMPKTESGKLNRPGLPRPAGQHQRHTEPSRTDTERALATVFSDLLSTPTSGDSDDFFALGGDSILSVQLASRARAVGLPVNPRMIFENPTPAQLAAAVDALEASGDGASPDNGDDASETRFEPMTTSGLSGYRLGCGDPAVVEVSRRNIMTAAEAETQADIAPDIEDVMALSPLQEGLYSLTALAEFTEGEPADDPYVIGMAADIYGALDVALLRRTARRKC